MSEADPQDAETIRARGAEDERAAVLQIVERHLRHLAYGHGVTGAQALEHIIEEIRARGAGDDAARG